MAKIFLGAIFVYEYLKRLSGHTLKLILFIVTIFLVSCSTFQVQDPHKLAEQTYRKDLKLKIDGKTFFGTTVLPRKSSYEITVYPEGNIDRLIVQTCHRDYTVDKPKTGWFSDAYTFSFAPVLGMEDNRACPMEIAALEEKKVRNGFAFIDFQDARDEINLPTTLRCNGKESYQEGVAICQAAAGLRQSIIFGVPVKHEGSTGACGVLEQVGDKVFEWSMANEKCVYYFVAKERHKNGKRRAFRLNAIGFTSVPVR